MLLACEYSRFSLLVAARDVSPGGKSAPQRQKFHTASSFKLQASRKLHDSEMVTLASGSTLRSVFLFNSVASSNGIACKSQSIQKRS